MKEPLKSDSQSTSQPFHTNTHWADCEVRLHNSRCGLFKLPGQVGCAISTMGLLEEYSRSSPYPNPPKNLAGLKKLVAQGQFVTASGIPSFDALLGGGQVVGSTCLFDIHGTYASYFVKLFAAQGLVNSHRVCLISATGCYDGFLKSLPGLAGSNKDPEPSTGDDYLDIAWRYKDILPQTTAPPKSSFSHQFDMASTLNLSDCSTSEVSKCALRVDPRKSLCDNLNAVLEHINSIAATSQKQVNRIVIESLASPLWGRQPESLTNCLANFLLRLRLILRDSFNVAYITLPPSVIKAVEPQTRWMTYADYAFQLDGFDGCDASVTPNPLYRDYDGLLKVIRLPSLSRFNLEPVSRPLTYDWAFKLQRRQFIVQHLHLPPCLSETASRSTVTESIISCSSSGGGKAIDF
ncbi:Elongator subunit elp4 [Sparganum proliferum]